MKNFIKKHFNVIFTSIAAVILTFSIVFVAISTGALGGIKKDPLPDWETLYNEQNYGEVKDLKKNFSEEEIFDQKLKEKYYVYFYSPTCSHCSEIRTKMTEYAVAENCKTLYFVDTSKNSVPGPSKVDDTLINKITENGEDRFLVDLNEDSIYSKNYDHFYSILNVDTGEPLESEGKKIIFATQAEAQTYVNGLTDSEKYSVQTEDFEKTEYFGFSTEWFATLENAENSLRFKEVRSLVGKDKFEDIKIFGTPSLLEITPTLIENGEEENNTEETTDGEESEEILSNHFEISNVFIGSTEIANKVAELTEKLSYYSISYNLDGGHFLEGDTIPYEYKTGEGLSTLPIAYKDGVRFDHWEYASSESGSSSMSKLTEIPASLKENLVLYATWTDNARITFNLMGGHRTNVEDETETSFVNDGFKIGATLEPSMLPDNIQKEGFEFVGWSFKDDNNVITESFVLAEYNTLYAVYTAI